MPSYPYQELQEQDQIRLLLLEPGQYDDPLIGSLKHVNVAQALEYDAISYCWTNCMENAFELRCLKEDYEGEVIEADIRNGDLENAKLTPMKVKIGDMPTHPSETVRAMYYAAGGARPSGELICDGHRVILGGELYSALKRFRLEDRPRQLWADAVCIDQNNLDEKAAQIKQMSRIYHNAQTVLVWLGESLVKVDQAGEALQAIDNRFGELWSLFEKEGVDSFKSAFLSGFEVLRIRWDHLAELLRRTWFRRIWCLQEIVNARNPVVHIGQEILPWSFFEVVMGTLHEFNLDVNLLSEGDELGSKTVHTMFTMRRFQHRPSLFDLLGSTRQFKSTLPCDKVFALLALIPEEERDAITVDYRASTESVYKQVAVTQMSKHQSLGVLYFCYKPCNTPKLQLPSWVPDWTQPLWHKPYSSIGLLSHACSVSDSECIIMPDQDAIMVRGCVIDEILLIDNVRTIPESALTRSDAVDQEEYERRKANGTELFEEHQTNLGSHVYNHLRRLTNRFAWVSNAILNVAFPSKEVQYEEFENLWRTFMCNQTPQGETPGPEWATYFSAWAAETVSSLLSKTEELREELAGYAFYQTIGWAFCGMAGSPEDVASSQELKSHAEMFDNVHTKWCNNRRFFRSKKGRFGWCPEGVEIGDKIVIVHGLDVPLVLRQVEKGFEVCGDCYLHGIMAGEAVDTDTEPQMLCLT